MIVAVSRAHGGKTPDTDVGSTFDADHDGKIQFDEREEFLAGIYSQAMESKLRELGHQVFVYGAGDYSARAKEMRLVAPDVIVYPHLDVRNSTNPLFFHDEASKYGPSLCNNVADAVYNVFPELGKPRVSPATATASPGGQRICALHRHDNGVVLLMEIFTTALAASWADSNQLKKLVDAGAASAVGIDKWAKTRIKQS